MHDVQMQLQELKTRLDTERAEVFTEEERVLVERVKTLKQEFRDLLIELRRRRAADVLSDDVSISLGTNILLAAKGDGTRQQFYLMMIGPLHRHQCCKITLLVNPVEF